ncbi:phage tail tip lysozyme [Eikenella corrodens]|uniref:TraG N-terminal Proteobacteria domain-containing protein n=2 Tax=Eikenella TaxID=538 RepID=A0A1A9RS95_EIKCO|nr:phage tail tip lysozyme [Eikenella corrodens]OAM19798.1 hypothetical protein A7P90_04855 [Eikenella corrodens]OAM23525.1 hypothetical protein A7P89_03105 [Eikenella corrodens]
MSSRPHFIRSTFNTAAFPLGRFLYNRTRIGKIISLIMMLLIQLPAWADALPASIDAGADQDITTLWVVGDIDVLAKGLDAVAMFFNGAGTGSPLISLLQLGALMALTSMLVQFITKRTMQPVNNFLMIIIVSALFIPKTSVWVASYYDATGGAAGGAVGFRKVDNVPIGVAYPLGMFSYVSKRLTEQYDTGMQVMPDSAMTGGTTAPEGGILTHGAEGYFSPLKTVLRLRNQFSGPENTLLLANLANASQTCNWSNRWGEADKGGIFNVLARGKQTGMVRIALPAEKAGDPPVIGLVGCSDAGKIISLMMVQNVVNLPGKNYSQTAVSAIDNRNLATVKGGSVSDAKRYERAQSELDQLPAAMAAAASGDTSRSGAAMGINDPTAILNTVRSQIQQGQVQPAALAQVFTAGNSVSVAEIEANMIFSHIVQSCIGSNDANCARQAFMLTEARNRSAVDAAGEASLFQNFMGHSMNILMFIYIVMSPIMIFIILVMGWNGIRIMGGYLMFAAWINSWLPLNSAIAYYMLQSYNNRMRDLILTIAASNEPSRVYSPTVISSIFDGTQDMLASASTMMSSVPLVMLSLMSASIYGLVQLAQRANMVGKDFVDEDKAAPKLDQSEVVGMARMIANSSAGGVLTTDNFSQNLVHNADASNTATIQLQTSQEAVESARHAIAANIQMMEGAADASTLAHVDSTGKVTQTGVVYTQTEDGRTEVRIAHAGEHAMQSGEKGAVGIHADKIVSIGKEGVSQDTVSYTDSQGQSHAMSQGQSIADTKGIQTSFGTLDSKQLTHSVSQNLSDSREDMRSLEYATSSATSHGLSTNINRTAFASILANDSATAQQQLLAGANEAAQYDRSAAAALQSAAGNSSAYFNTLSKLESGSPSERAAALAAIHGLAAANPDQSGPAPAYANMSQGALAVHKASHELHSENQAAIDKPISSQQASGIGHFSNPLNHAEKLDSVNQAIENARSNASHNGLSIEEQQKILQYNQNKLREMVEFNNQVQKDYASRSAGQKIDDLTYGETFKTWDAAGEEWDKGNYVMGGVGYILGALHSVVPGSRILGTADSQEGMYHTVDPDLNNRIHQMQENQRIMQNFNMQDGTRTIDGRPIEEVLGHKPTHQAGTSHSQESTHATDSAARLSKSSAPHNPSESLRAVSGDHTHPGMLKANDMIQRITGGRVNLDPKHLLHTPDHQGKGVGLCANGSSIILREAGLIEDRKHGSAPDMARQLQNHYGWEVVTTGKVVDRLGTIPGYTPRDGQVAFIAPHGIGVKDGRGGDEFGHICVWVQAANDGKGAWVSDYYQGDRMVSSDKYVQAGSTITILESPQMKEHFASLNQSQSQQGSMLNNSSSTASNNLSFMSQTGTGFVGSGKTFSLSSEQRTNMLAIYDAARANGLSHNQAAAFTAEVGRENGFRSHIMSGSHTDDANHRTNKGIISWQNERSRNLDSWMRSRGMMNADGSYKRGQDAVNAQVAFAINEMRTVDTYNRTERVFLNNPNVSYQEATRVLGKNYIAWRYDDPKYAEGHNNRDGFYNTLQRELTNRSNSKR